jgi:hypothetical protein
MESTKTQEAVTNSGTEATGLMQIPEAIRKQKYISLTTFRKNGTPVSTPVWAAEREDKIYVVTRKDSGKSKRIRNNPNVKVAPCTIRGKVTGPEFAGKARILPSGAESRMARQAVRRKYWLARLSVRPKQNEYLEIEISG